VSTPVAYWLAVGIAAAICATLCVLARRWPGPWTRWPGRAIALVLAADATTFVATPLVEGTWSTRSSLPLQLCDVALAIAAIACWLPHWQFGVELTYFWGLAGTLQAVATPNLSVGFPHLDFFEFVIGHVGIVVAALFLVIGLRRTPRRGAVLRVFVLTAVYTGLVGAVDAITGANYMFLAAVPAHTSLLSVLGPWPWYLFGATGVAIAALLILDAPFWGRRAPRYVSAASAASSRPSSAARPATWST
jgi:hypothetical integral membrane protein (TIGR02206 family)